MFYCFTDCLFIHDFLVDLFFVLSTLALTKMFVCMLTGDFTSFKTAHVPLTRRYLGYSYLDHGELLLPPSCNLPKTPDLHIQV